MSLTVSLLQTTLAWEDKEANLNMLQQKINAIQEHTQLIILPEMFSTGFSMNSEKLAETMDGNTVQWMKKIAAAKKVILTGSLIIKEEGYYFNRLLWILPNGQFGYYDKRHLFAYAHEDVYYHAGKSRLITSVNGWKINLIVCYDLRFPVWVRQKYDEAHNFEYDILICVANWPERRNMAWKTLLQARAIENQCYVIGVNRVGTDGNEVYHSGDSMLINALGSVLYQNAHDEVIKTFELSREELQNVRKRYPFSKDADIFKLMV